MAKKQRPPISNFVKDSLEAFQTYADYYSTEYTRGAEDLDFAMGIDQWPQNVRAQREKDGRPCLTDNRMLPFVNQVVNDIRQARPAISVKPVDDKADVETARVIQGLIRNIEYTSNANTAYDTAAWNAVTAGYGFIRINTKWADDKSFQKEIEIMRVPDFQNVLLDPNSIQLDGSDAEGAFVFVDMPRAQFEREYPDANPVGFADYGRASPAWCSQNTVRVAERFYKVYKNVTLAQTADGQILPTDQAKALGLEIINTRQSQVTTVKWCKMTGAEVIEESDWEGQYIPIVPVYGIETWLQGRRQCFGLIHNAKDPQMRYNYWLTSNTEIIALQPKAPFIGVAGQFNDPRWETANIETHAYLEYTPVKLPDGTFASAPQRQAPPQGSPAMFQEMLAAADSIKAALGIFDASLGARGNETSGKAILARQAEGDNATFHFADNLAQSLRQVGRICVDLIGELYTGQQAKRIIGEDGKEAIVPINQVALKQGDKLVPMSLNGYGQPIKIDLQAGKYDVVCSMGPSYATKRQENAAAMMELMTAVPGAAQVIGDLAVRSMDFPEAEQIADRLKRMLPPQLQDAEGMTPEQAQLQQASAQIQEMQVVIQQMDAALKAKQEDVQFEQQVKLAELENDRKKIEIDAARAAADIAKIQAETNAQIPAEVMQTMVATVTALQDQLNDVSGALDAILSHEEEKLMAESNPVVGGVTSEAPIISDVPNGVV